MSHSPILGKERRQTLRQAKAIINLKEGTIQLEGPADSVRHYIDAHHPPASRLRAAEKGMEKPSPRDAVEGNGLRLQRHARRGLLPALRRYSAS